MKTNKKRILITIIIIFTFLLLITGTAEAKAQAQKIKVNIKDNIQTSKKITKYELINNRITLKTDINGHKVRIKSPQLSKNKYLKLVNVTL